MEYVALCGDEFKWVYWNSIYNFRDSRLIRTETLDLVLYLSRIFILVVVILISIYIIVLEGVFLLIIILSSSSITLLILYGGRDGLKFGTIKVIRITKMGTLSIIDPDTYSLSG